MLMFLKILPFVVGVKFSPKQHHAVNPTQSTKGQQQPLCYVFLFYLFEHMHYAVPCDCIEGEEKKYSGAEQMFENNSCTKLSRNILKNELKIDHFPFI